MSYIISFFLYDILQIMNVIEYFITIKCSTHSPGVMRPIEGDDIRMFREGRDALKCYFSVSNECRFQVHAQSQE